MSSQLRARSVTTSASPLYLLELENWVEPFPRHWHEEWGIAVIEQGVNRFWMRGGWGEAPRGTIVVVPPGVIHDGGLSRSPWGERMSYLSVETMERIAQTCSGRRQPPTFRSLVIDDDDLAAQLRGLHDALSAAGGGDLFEADELLIRVIGTLLVRHGSVRAEEVRADQTQAIRRAKLLMRERLSEGITLHEIADAVGLSVYHFIREFRKRVGMTPHAWLQHLRVIAAQRLLSEGNPIADVAVATGFADQSHLTRVFRKTIGVTPGAFRDVRAT